MQAMSHVAKKKQGGEMLLTAPHNNANVETVCPFHCFERKKIL